MRIFLKALILLAFFISLFAPIATWLQTNGQVITSSELKAEDILLLTFPLFGMLAFAFVWIQIMLGSFMPILNTLFKPGTMLKFHMGEGIFSILLVVLHPTLLVLAQFLQKGFGSHLIIPDFIAPELIVFLILGEVALVLYLIAISAALLRNNPILVRHWRKFHFLNYLVFFLVFVHSMNLGNHINGFMRNLYYFYFVTVIIGLVYRRVYREIELRRKIAEANAQRQSLT